MGKLWTVFEVWKLFDFWDADLENTAESLIMKWLVKVHGGGIGFDTYVLVISSKRQWHEVLVAQSQLS